MLKLRFKLGHHFAPMTIDRASITGVVGAKSESEPRVMSLSVGQCVNESESDLSRVVTMMPRSAAANRV